MQCRKCHRPVGLESYSSRGYCSRCIDSSLYKTLFVGIITVTVLIVIFVALKQIA